MKLIGKMAVMLTAATMIACQSNEKKEEVTAPLIEKSVEKLASDRMSPETLMNFGRVGGTSVSPDGKKVLYTVSYVSIEQNKSNSEIFVVNVDGTNKKQLTTTVSSESQPTWIDGGKSIAFLYPENGKNQLWKMDADGSNRVCLSDIDTGVFGFKFSPDETKVLFFAEIPFGKKVTDVHPDLTKSSGKLISGLMYKHWDEWVESIPHSFVADLKDGKLTNVVDIVEGEPFEVPMKPFGGIEQLDWSPDGRTIAYTSRKKVGKAYAESTNSDIYLYDIASKTTRNLSEGMMGYDQNPLFSPDGKYIVWESMEHEGWESDKSRLFICELATGEKRDLSIGFDFNVSHLVWNNDSQSLFFTGCVKATTQIYQIDLAGSLKKLTEGQHDYVSATPADNLIVATRHSFSAPTEVFAVNPSNGEATNISQENDELMAQLAMGRVEERWVETVDKKQMLVWVIYPPHFDPNKKYPAVLYCQGGPQSTVSQFWSYRWNMQTFAASDYIIVAPNRRGLPGFGKEWLEQISGDYGGLCMQDYFSAIDNVKKESFVDENRLGCVGASFGGYSVYWMAGNHNKRFKAFISHCGIFNFDQQYLETEEMWFANRDFGGPYWDKSEATKKTYANSPHLFVDKWDTPIFVIHGEKDYRILASQGMAAFNAAQLRGIPSEMLLFPDEGHWVVKPQNAVLWYRSFTGWLDKWLK